MAFTVKDWKQLPAELEPTAGETVADWRARIAAYAVANPTLVTPLNAAAIADIETRLSGYTDSQVSAEATARGTAVSAEATARASADTTLTAAVAAKADAAATTTALAAKQATSEKGQPNGYASLDGTGKVPSAQLPSAQSGSGADLYIQQSRPAEGTRPWEWAEIDGSGNPTGLVEYYAPDPNAPTSAPSNTVAPAISGTAENGQTVSCSTGTWTQSPTSYARQWKRDGANIGGATGVSYTLQSADVGHAVKCTVTAANAVGSTSADSNTINPTNPAAPTNSVAPAITGTAETGQTLDVLDRHLDGRADELRLPVEAQRLEHLGRDQPRPTSSRSPTRARASSAP
jgi:hypothetical protein